jgi:hypothetical protein
MGIYDTNVCNWENEWIEIPQAQSDNAIWIVL